MSDHFTTYNDDNSGWGDCILHFYAKLRDDVIKYLSTVTLKHSAQPEVKLSLFVKTDGYEKLKYEARRKVFASRLSKGQTTHGIRRGQWPNGLYVALNSHDHKYDVK